MIIYWVILAAAALLIAAYSYHFVKRILKFYGVDGAGKTWVIARTAISALIGVICINVRSTGAMIVLHIFAISVLMDLIALAAKRLCNNMRESEFVSLCRRLYGCGVIPFLITILLLGYGFFNMNHVTMAGYSVETSKSVNDYRVILITDTHYGTIQSTDILAEQIEQINSLSADLVVLGGDIVEEGTSKQEMCEAFRAFGGIKSKYGIYYVFGNHDRQPYTDKRSYTDKELSEAICSNGISILEDEYVEIQDDLVIAGRGDAAWGNSSGRASTKTILEGVDPNKYIIMADHQPIQADENDAQGVDLQLSGHTHAGQIWPVGLLSEMTGVMNYGEYQKGRCRVIVSSGFTGWGYPIRTQGHCEYVVVDIKSQK